MDIAISHAKNAAKNGEVPVGAVIVRDDEIISVGANRRETDKNALSHAEIIAINEACKKLGGWRLSDCTLYVTLEPCPMCAGAIVNSRIKRVVYGTRDAKAGALGSVLNMNSYPLNHKIGLCTGVCESECAGLLSDFFKELRK
ncbi:MAG: tRNA adenosine(34) deaminase TadA [Clostridia bacterium]|nr:tRNA adenosine(34) deaminase TadA [Clostridia bacterium]